jgi:uncharacterized protein YhfF
VPDELPSTIDGLPVCLFVFPGPLRDQLVAAVLAGEKTATSSLRAEYLPSGPDRLPAPGERSVVVDSQHRRVAVIETTEVRVLRIADVDAAFARDEGEGFETVAAWRVAHERFWAEHFGPVTDDTLVVAERFRLVSVS